MIIALIILKKKTIYLIVNLKKIVYTIVYLVNSKQ